MADVSTEQVTEMAEWLRAIGYGFDFAWVFVGGRVERRDVERRIEFDIARAV